MKKNYYSENSRKGRKSPYIFRFIILTRSDLFHIYLQYTKMCRSVYLPFTCVFSVSSIICNSCISKKSPSHVSIYSIFEVKFLKIIYVTISPTVGAWENSRFELAILLLN